MDPNEYRKEVLRETREATRAMARSVKEFRNEKKSATERALALGQAGQLTAPKDLELARDLAADRDEAPELRVAALAQLGPLLAKDRKAIPLLIKIVSSDEEPADVRAAALTALKAAAFHYSEFERHRPEYLEALRAATLADHSRLRQRALGVLAREKDSKTLKQLEEGLRRPDKALVSPQKALQLLSYDSKRNTFEMLEGIVRSPPNPAARHQALRNMGADAASQPFLAKLLRNKKEDLESRLIAMSALHAMEPKTLHKVASAVVADDDDDDDLRAACLAAMAPVAEVPPTEGLRAAAVKLATKGRSSGARSAAKRYLAQKPRE